MLAITACKEKETEIDFPESFDNSEWKLEYRQNLDNVGHINLRLMADGTIQSVDYDGKEVRSSSWEERNDSIILNFQRVYQDRKCAPQFIFNLKRIDKKSLEGELVTWDYYGQECRFYWYSPTIVTGTRTK
ncbi:hypothetical protein D0T49_03925 [Paludibacter sp. 221]|nr:hypothetical protein [Paludibacter sp. 221]